MRDGLRAASGSSVFVNGAAGRLHVRDFGGDGPTVVALHGVTGGTFLWDGVAAELTGQARLVAMDFRGHGLSDWSAERDYTTDAYAADLEAVLDALGSGTPPILMGSSWGALAMMRVAARRPDAGSALIVVDVEPSFEAGPADVHPRPYRFDSIGDVEAWERKANPGAPDAALRAFARGSVVATEDGTLLRRHDPFFLTRWPFREDDLWEEIGRIAAPTLVIHGARSFVREAVCRRMAGSFANGEFAQVEDAGHLVPLEQPGRVAALARDWIDRIGR